MCIQRSFTPDVSLLADMLGCSFLGSLPLMNSNVEKHGIHPLNILCCNRNIYPKAPHLMDDQAEAPRDDGTSSRSYNLILNKDGDEITK